MTALLEIEDLTAGYGATTVLRGVTLSVAAGSVTALVGSNGAGKTTLMRAVSGLLPVTSGSLRFDGNRITRETPNRRVERGLALVPEGRLVFPDFTVAETLRIGAYAPHARAGWRARADDMYALFPRLAERRGQRAQVLSGGEQQMLALARALMSRPRLLLLDEPSLGLAPMMAALVFETIASLRATGLTVFVVEQDVDAALTIADYAYVLENGSLVAEGEGPTLLGQEAIREAYLGL
jgi:branched-chain amino acid transport system ATP-binding protein